MNTSNNSNGNGNGNNIHELNRANRTGDSGEEAVVGNDGTLAAVRDVALATSSGDSEEVVGETTGTVVVPGMNTGVLDVTGRNGGGGGDEIVATSSRARLSALDFVMVVDNSNGDSIDRVHPVFVAAYIRHLVTKNTSLNQRVADQARQIAILESMCELHRSETGQIKEMFFELSLSIELRLQQLLWVRNAVENAGLPEAPRELQLQQQRGVLDEEVRLQRENNHLRTTHIRFQRENDQLRIENLRLQGEIDELQLANARLQRRVADEENPLRREIDQLRREISRRNLLVRICSNDTPYEREITVHLPSPRHIHVFEAGIFRVAEQYNQEVAEEFENLPLNRDDPPTRDE